MHVTQCFETLGVDIKCNSCNHQTHSLIKNTLHILCTTCTKQNHNGEAISDHVSLLTLLYTFEETWHLGMMVGRGAYTKSCQVGRMRCPLYMEKK